MPETNLEKEGARLFRICNSCRYCEGFCAVYPAMERLTAFPPADLDYLANLCHNCGECYYACQYAPPHEFGVNMPKLLAELRLASYEKYAWPQSFARAYRANGPLVCALLIAGFAAALLMVPKAGASNGSFYAVISHEAMADLFGAVTAFAALAMLTGLTRFWKAAGAPLSGSAALGGIKDALSLRYLGKDAFGSARRRVFHHLTFYGFALSFASTSVAALYHYAFHWSAPYSYSSLPVILGTLGGISLAAGSAGLFTLKRNRDAATQDPAQSGVDYGFLTLLFLASLTGLLLLARRETPLMPPLLAIHLAVILVLFLTLPYGKFVHGIYRTAALIRNAAERKTPPA